MILKKTFNKVYVLLSTFLVTIWDHYFLQNPENTICDLERRKISPKKIKMKNKMY